MNAYKVQNGDIIRLKIKSIQGKPKVNEYVYSVDYKEKAYSLRALYDNDDIKIFDGQPQTPKKLAKVVYITPMWKRIKNALDKMIDEIFNPIITIECLGDNKAD